MGKTNVRLYKSFVLLSCFIIYGLTIHAQSDSPPENYTNTTMRQWLRDNWYNGYQNIVPNSSGYAGARLIMYNTLDVLNGNLVCIYSGMTQLVPVGGYSDADAAFPFNCEHIVPQSLFNEQYPMKADLHHLAASFSDWNTARSNYPYSEIVDSQTEQWIFNTQDINCQDSAPCMPTSNIDAYTEILLNGNNSRCEPRESVKGNIARSVFYFFTMYPAYQIGDIGNINTLYQWHQEDPPTIEELTRNGLVENYQGNRNPYIDHPEWVYKAWIAAPISGIDDATSASFNMNVTGYNKTNSTLNLSVITSNNTSATIEIFDLYGQQKHIQNLEINSHIQEYQLLTQGLGNGIYIIKLNAGDSGYKTIKYCLHN